MDLQRRLSLHPNVVRFMGACCHIPHTGRPFQDDTLDNFPVCICCLPCCVTRTSAPLLCT